MFLSPKQNPPNSYAKTKGLMSFYYPWTDERSKFKMSLCLRFVSSKFKLNLKSFNMNQKQKQEQKNKKNTEKRKNKKTKAKLSGK